MGLADFRKKSGYANLDSITDALETIDYPHHEVHGGSAFTVSDVLACDTTTVKWQVTTPNTTKYSHMLFSIECTGEVLGIVTEGSDRTDGTALVEINRRRVGTPTVAGTIVTRTPTGGATDGATQIATIRTGATGVGSQTVNSGGSRGTNEFILKPNTKYVISATTYAAVQVTFIANWYEHTDKT